MIPRKIAKLLNSQKGFTLIELIVVFAIIGILSFLGIAGFNNYNKIQTLNAAANDVATALNLAKSRALSQVKLGGVCTTPVPRPLEGYEVKLSLFGPYNRYRLIIYCGGFTFTIDNKMLPTNTRFRAIGAGTTSDSFFFPVLIGGVTAAGQITLYEVNNSIPPKIIIIDSVGGIRVQ